MASHKQSFQCFDTITDDPPLKPPFPHGHCSATSFRGSYGSTRLEPLEDHGCYLCANHQQAKTMASEASGAYSNPWYHFQAHPHPQQYTNRRPIRPEEAPGQNEDHHHHHRRSRKIVLVKNSDPSVRRTIVLHRRSLRSLALFMDEVSELMHCLIRKLYTLEGHKIDSVQTLLHCPSILVCVGREPFHPLLLDSFRKNSYDKLPRLNIKSRSSVCSDEKGAKKNVNFGLETNRSTIHPRCDSSNRSARLSQSISSEKLFPNRLNSLPPGQRGDCPHTGENMMDDDIEKRVLVNQDGSLSMEMKVRFRLLHNETLHWSTEVKKSKSSFNESHIVPACSLSHGSAEGCSEADSLSAGEADETHSNKCYQRHFEEPHCQHCCTHCQEYDIWKNPVPPSQGSVRRIRSSSSSASSRRIVCKKASTDSMRTMSSEEYTEHVVEKATCIQQTIGQQGDTTIEQCTINHCCSRSEVRSVTPKTKSTSEDKRENTHASDNDENRPDVISSNLPKDQLSVKITQSVEEDERPVSVVSSSSQILASLKEDEDDEDVDLPLSISRASRGQQEDEESKDAESNPCSVTPCKSPASLAHVSPRPPSKASSSGQSKTARKFASPEVGDEEVRSEASASPRALSGPKTCKCADSKDTVTLGTSKSNDHLEDIDGQDTETEERALSTMSAKLKSSTKSLSESSGPYENGNTLENTEVNDGIIEERSSSAISVKSNTSGKSNKTNVSEVLEQDGRAHSAGSIKSHRADKSRNYEISDNVSEEQNFEARTSSAMSVKSNTSVRSKLSENCFDELAKSQDSVEERTVSVVSSKSNISVKSSQSQSAPDGTSEERIEEKASSVKSGTLNKSGIEDLTNDDQTEERVHSSFSIKSNISARSKMSFELSEFEDDEQDRAPSSVSIKSFVSQKSMSDISETASLQEGGECLNLLNTECVKLNTPGAETATQVELPGERSPSSVSSISNISKRSRTSKISEADQDEAHEKEDVQERSSSTISVKSTTSARSRKSKTTTTSESGEEMKEQAPSVMSIKSNASLKSNKSKMEEKETENRASSGLSVKSEVSTLSKKSNLSDREQLEERAPSALSTKSNSSCISKQSKVSDMAADVVAEDRDDLRSASVLSSKSNISAKSMKTMVSEKEQTEERAQSAFSAQSNQSGVTVSDKVEVTEERALSAMSSKSNASERLKESNNLKVPSALPRGSDHQTEERGQSALSTRSSVSTRSNKSRISNVLNKLVDAKDQEEERASSAMSGRSDISTKTTVSAKSTASKVSEVQAEETDAKDQEEERASSSLSAKSNISTKSKKSNAPTIDVNNDNKEMGDRVPSAMSGRSDISTKTNISAKSTASKVSEVQAEEPDAKDLEEERASSALSAKSNVSAKSKKSNASAIDVNTDNKEKHYRVPSAMSGRSDISTKTSISAKSKASNASEVQAEEPDNEESEVKAAGVTKSRISVRSNKSEHSEEEEVQNLNRPPSAISIMSEATPDENEISNEGEIQERAPSAVSAKSNSSVRSRTSKVSEIIIDEPDEQKEKRAPSSRSLKSGVSGRSGPEDPVNKDKKNEARTESALSFISNVSATSNKPEDSELISNIQQRAPSATSVTSKISARSKRSNISVAPKETGNTDTGDVRSSSAMSAKSFASEKSKHSERTTEDDEEANKVVERTTSSLSVKSTPSTTSDATVKSSVVPTKSNASAKSFLLEAEEPDRRSTSVLSNVSAESKVSKAGLDKKDNRSPSKLSVKSNGSTRSKKSKASEGQFHIARNTVDMELNRGESPVSDRSKVSQAENSNKYCAIDKSSSQIASSENDSEHEIPASPLSKKSAKSNISSVSSDSERGLTPTSTSVSIGIVEDHEADDVEEIDEGAVSVTSRKSASSKTEICGRSDVKRLSEYPVRITSETTQTPEDRPKSFASSKSNVSGKSKSKCSHCSSKFPRDTNQDRDDVASNKSSKTSANGSVRQSSLTEEICTSNKASVHTEITGKDKTESPDVTHKSQSVCSKCSSTQQKRKISSASAISDSDKSNTKEENTAEMTDRPKSNISRSSSHLKVNGQKNDVKTTVVNGRNNKLSTKSTQKVEDNTPMCHSATLSVTSGNQLSPIPPKSPKKSKKPVILLGDSNDRISHNVPAPVPKEHTDHLNAAAEKTESCRSDTNVSDIKSEKSSKCRKRIGSDSSCHKMDEDMSELSPSCLPNASPTEVVNEWLRKIPSDTALCDLGDEFHDNFDLTEPLCTSHVPSGNENVQETLQHDVTKLETQHKMEEAHVVNAEGVIDKKSPEVNEGDHSQRGDELKMFNSSVLVMKVLLSPKLDRCNSLPEVSPVYGRKLSTSAQALLDCLANLQLLDFGTSDKDDKKEKYQELMCMLKSLWLCDPKESEKTSEETNKHLDKEYKARSSSGVDVNSGSTGSGKSSVNDGVQVQIITECEGLDTLTKVQEVDETVEEEASETPVSKYDSATPGMASQARWTPEMKDTVEKKPNDDAQSSDETIRNNDSPREFVETPLSSNKSSGNNNKETESDHQEDTSSGSAPTLQRGQLSKRLSQDPDPLWVLNLLNKLEKQFMTNYVDAMAEFKVRWNLDDNEQLDAMISELQDEVRRRIQLSIDRELRKIQGRAGRPRPPKETMSRESTIQTEQRRRRLKVMRNQSVDPQPAKSDDEYTMTGTDFSDQRSDDEYCPCDTCLKKKMVSKHVLPVEMLNSAPVMMDFDLRRILQIKKSSPTNENIESTASKMEGENVGLEAVKEEDEKEGADKEILASVAQEIKEEYEKRESEEGEEKDNLRKDMDEVGEIAEMSDNTKTAQHKAVEQDEGKEENDETDYDLMAVKESARSSRIDDELDEDVANDDISEFDDIMQAEEATKKHNEEESEEQDESTFDETAEEEQTGKSEYIKEGETTGEETAENGQTAEVLATEEDDIAGNEAAEDGETTNYDTEEELNTAESKTAEDGETAEAVTTDKSDDETVEEGETVNDDTAEEDEVAENETAEDETGEESETVNDNTAEEHEVAKNETAEDGQSAEDETGEESETVNDDTAEEHETADNETSEDETGEENETVNDNTEEEHETAENETAEDGQTAEDETGEEGETVNDDSAEEHEVAENETAEDGQTAEDETGEESETVNDDTAEEHETADNETAEDGQTAEDETGEESETVNDDTAEEHETADNETAEDETGEESETVNDNTKEEHEVAENETAEDGQTAENETGEEGETVNDDSAEEHKLAENETAEDGQTAEDETGEESETVNDDTAEEYETADNETAEDGQTAEDETGDGETVKDNTAEEDETTENETAEDGQTAEKETGDGETVNDDTAEEHETAENETAEDGQTAENETGDGETVNDDTAEEHEMTETETAENGQTAGDESGEEGEIVNDDTTEEDVVAENETAEDGQTAENETGECGTGNADTAEEDEVAENETTENETAEDSETAEDKTSEEGQTTEAEIAGEDKITEDETAEDGDTAAKNESVEDGHVVEEDEITEDDTAEEGETSANNESVENAETDEDGNTGDDDQTVEKGETANDDTVEECEMAENESVEGGQTAETKTAGETDTGDEDTADEDTTEAELEMSKEKATVKDGTTAEDKNAEVELAERKQTPDHEATGEETDKSQSDVEEDKESVSCEAAEGDILSKLEDTDCLDETPLKNQGNVVVDSVNDKDEECAKEDDNVELTANKLGLVANNGESAEAGDEAEDDTEPDMETDDGEHDGNAPAVQSVLQPKQTDDKPYGAASFNVLVKHNSESEDGVDADGEDSETDEHSQVVDLSSGSEGKTQKNTVHKNLKMIVHALTFLKLSATGRPERREEDNEHEVEDEETPEDGSDDAEESSCVEKDEVEELNIKEKGKLSDITEDTAEEGGVQTNETNDDSKDSEWESSENALQKQMTKSSLESQQGSFEEVHEELTKNQNGSNHLKANW